jgi:hypothetical protein
MIERLILLSPVGLSSSYVDIVSTKIEDFIQAFLYKMKAPPAQGFKFFGFLGNWVFNYVCKNKFPGLKLQVIMDIFKYVKLLGRVYYFQRFPQLFI